jgi:hypothetical protein
MGDDITIGVTEIVNNIEVTAQPNDQVIDIEVIDNSDDVTLNVTPNVIEVNINKGSSYARWGSIFGNLTDQADLTNALFNKADLVDGKVPSYQLPSFVDDVIEVANYAALPTVGEIGKIYITLDDNKIYRWSGSIYIEIASNQAIWGAITGSLTNQTDLVNALNLKADKSTTLTINGTTFDLSANRTYTIPTHDAVTLGTANGLSLSGQVLSLGLSGASSTGALSSTDWNTFNNKLSSLSGAVLTTTDQSVAGVKTFTNLAKFTNNTGSFAVEIDTTSSDALVIKNAGTTTLQIGKNGEIIAAKYKISGGFSSQFLKANGDLDSTVYTPASRTITINGVTQDLTANRSFTVATHDAVTIGTANGLSLSGQALSLALASGSTTGALSSTDWTTFNNKLSNLNGAVLTTTDQNIAGLKTFTSKINAPIFELQPNNTIGSNPNYIGQQMATNDTWKIYGNTSLLDQGEMVFEIGDNGGSQLSNGQRFRFYYDNSSGGTAKSPFILDYNEAIFNANVTGTSFIKSGGTAAQILAADGTVITAGTNVTISGGTISASGGLSGSGTTNFVSKFTGSSSLGDSSIFDDGTNVGIGTTIPTYKFEIIGGSDYQQLRVAHSSHVLASLESTVANRQVLIGYKSATREYSVGLQTNGDFSWYDNTANVTRMTLTSGGSVVVNNLGTGLVYSNAGALTSTNPSDERLKDDITDLQYGLNEILQLRPVSYNWKNDTINQGKQFGFIAQEVKEVMPELISEFTTTEDEEEVVRLGLDKEGIYATLVNAIKEQNEVLVQLKAEIELLKQK